jgi:hypothetical protein
MHAAGVDGLGSLKGADLSIGGSAAGAPAAACCGSVGNCGSIVGPVNLSLEGCLDGDILTAAPTRAIKSLLCSVSFQL